MALKEQTEQARSQCSPRNSAKGPESSAALEVGAIMQGLWVPWQ